MIYPEKNLIEKVGKYWDEVVEKSSKISMNLFKIYQEKSADLSRSLPKKVADIFRFYRRFFFHGQDFWEDILNDF